MKAPENIIYETKDAWYPDYSLKVVRLGKHIGELTVRFKTKVIYRQDVHLAFGAEYGPDLMDVQSWGHTSCKVVDLHLKGRGIVPQPPEK